MIHNRFDDTWWDRKDFRAVFTLPERILIHAANLVDRLLGWMESPIDAILAGYAIGMLMLTLYVVSII